MANIKTKPSDEHDSYEKHQHKRKTTHNILNLDNEKY